MKQILSSIGIIVMLVICSLADIESFPDSKESWDKRQCTIFEVPDHLMGGSDSDCAEVSKLMVTAINVEGTDCLINITADWPNEIMTRIQIEYYEALAGAPETRSLEELPCEDCPFDKLERCPQCVEIFDEYYQQSQD